VREEDVMKRSLCSLLFIGALVILLARCGGGGGGEGSTPASSAKSITAFSFISPAATGVIDENAKTISITVAQGTNVTALVATFTTTGISVKVGATVQVSGSTPNDFTGPVVYRVTAADNSTATYTVTVAIATDTTPPTVLSTSPADGETVPVSTTAISVTFSEDMDPSTLSPATFILSGNTNIPGSVSYDSSSRTATFTLGSSSSLDYDANYTVTITTGAKDAAGNHLSGAYVWSFTTGQLLPDGLVTIEEFTVPTADSYPRAITAGPDGNLWFTEECGNKIGRITPDGVITEFPRAEDPWQLIPYDCAISGVGKGLHSITAGADGNLWFADSQNNRIWKMNTEGVIIGEYVVDSCPAFAGLGPHGITAGPNGTIWFAHLNCNYIGKIVADTGEMTLYSIPTTSSGTAHITAGPEDTIWFTEHGGGGSVNKIGKITMDGTITEYPAEGDSTTLSTPFEITAGSDGNVWFTERAGNLIGRITTEGSITKYPLAGDPTSLYTPLGIAAGPHETIWFTEGGAGSIGRISADNSITKFPVPSGDTGWHITFGPDGNLWFTELNANRIGKVLIQAE
jgi:virginiamycin B lyase